jgi:hypothetical protein
VTAAAWGTECGVVLSGSLLDCWARSVGYSGPHKVPCDIVCCTVLIVFPTTCRFSSAKLSVVLPYKQVIYSAWMGYGNYGCDVGGYRGNDGTKYATHFLRSAQLNAFLPLMENGGGGEHRPW